MFPSSSYQCAFQTCEVLTITRNIGRLAYDVPLAMHDLLHDSVEFAADLHAICEWAVADWGGALVNAALLVDTVSSSSAA